MAARGEGTGGGAEGEGAGGGGGGVGFVAVVTVEGTEDLSFSARLLRLGKSFSNFSRLFSGPWIMTLPLLYRLILNFGFESTYSCLITLFPAILKFLLVELIAWCHASG